MRVTHAVIALGLLAGVVLLAAGPVRAAEKKAKAQADGTGLKVLGELTKDDPKDKLRRASYSRSHPFKMTSGKTYRIDLTSPDFDTFLRVEDSAGKQVAFDDDGGEGLNSRLVYKAPRDDTYQLIVTSFPPGQTGKYLLVATEAGAADLLAQRAKNISGASAEERKEILAELLKDFNKRQDRLSAADGQLAFTVGYALESSDKNEAREAYKSFAKVLGAAQDTRLQQMARLFEGAARRMDLVGSEMQVKGNTADGKPLDWKSYRGKVVLVDFWATWCGPCRAELPNIKNMYEKYHDDGFDVVGVSLDFDKGSLEKFLRAEKLPWVSTYDKAAGKGGSMADYYGVVAIPLAVLVDREGRVVSLNARGPELGRLLEKYLGDGKKGESKEKAP